MVSDIKNRAEALTKVTRAYDFFRKAIGDALRVGVSPETIIDQLSPAEAQIADAVFRQIISEEVIVPEQQSEIESGGDTVVLDSDSTVVIDDTAKIRKEGNR